MLLCIGGFRDGASSGFVVNFQVLAGQSGRGVHATSHIRRGELVWCKNNTAVFARGSDFYRFLELVRDNLGNDAACDTVNMAYEITSPSGSRVVHADLDEGSLLNSAMYSRPGADESNNVNCHLPSGSRRVCTRCIYATRDIGPGQEFLEPEPTVRPHYRCLISHLLSSSAAAAAIVCRARAARGSSTICPSKSIAASPDAEASS